ncbi:hypothetical protein DER46DRAFT_675179 [Fusarium sp. MPI-SDFR-AT-0072]|nr:hypothetical protein DER46DRAFT_675179 [Fusarium sp. MPI-SDFR-AT-0072]
MNITNKGCQAVPATGKHFATRVVSHHSVPSYFAGYLAGAKTSPWQKVNVSVCEEGTRWLLKTTHVQMTALLSHLLIIIQLLLSSSHQFQRGCLIVTNPECQLSEHILVSPVTVSRWCVSQPWKPSHYSHQAHAHDAIDPMLDNPRDTYHPQPQFSSDSFIGPDVWWADFLHERHDQSYAQRTAGRHSKYPPLPPNTQLPEKLRNVSTEPVTGQRRSCWTEPTILDDEFKSVPGIFELIQIAVISRCLGL